MELIKKYKNVILSHKDEFIISGLAQIIYMSQSLVQNKLFAINFSTSGFGMWSLFTSIYALVAMLPFTALDQGIYSLARKYKNDNKQNNLYNMVILTYNIGFILYSFVFLGIYLIKREDFFASGSIIVFLAYTFSEIIKNTFLVIDNAYRNRKHILNIRIFGFTSRLILLILLGVLKKFTVHNVLVILFITNLLMLLMLYEYWGKWKYRFNIDEYKKFSKSIIKFSLPLMIWAIFGWLQNMIGRWYLNAFVDTESVALYTMLVSISYFVPNAYYTVMNAYIMPIVFERKEKIKKKFWFIYLSITAILLLVYWSVILCFGKYIVLLLADSKYLDIMKYLPITTLSSIFYVIAMMSTIEIYRKGQTSVLLLPTILPGIVMSTVGFVLIKNMGLSGAVVNYILGQCLYAVLVLRKSFKSIEQ